MSYGKAVRPLKHLDDIISTPPTETSRSGGRAWLIDLEAAYRAQGKDPALGSEVASWLVEAPWAHPFWHSYWIFLAHLRPMPDLPKLILHRPDATHEVWVHALDPDQPRQRMIETGDMKSLVPMNYAGQFVAVNDASAAQRVRTAVLAICMGALSPDTDFKREWVKLFGDEMLKK